MTAATEQLWEAIRSTALRRGEFQLPDGSVLHEYFDEYALASNPVLLRRVAEAMTVLLPAGTEVLVGIELGGVALAVALSAASGIPAAFVRRTRKTHGTRQQVEGCTVRNRTVVLVDDVVRTGSQLIAAAAVLRREAASVRGAVCVIDRGLGADAKLAAVDIRLRTLATVPR